MPLVEVVPHMGVDAAALEKAMEFYAFLGKKPVHVKQEIPGHVVNRLQAALCNESYSLVTRGIISAEHLGRTYLSPLSPILC